MIISEISINEYEKSLLRFQRYDLLCSPELLKYKNNFNKIKIYAAKENNEIIGLCPIQYVKIKKIFNKAMCYYAPFFINEDYTHKYFMEFVDKIVRLHRKMIRTLAITFIPFIEKTKYDNFEKLDDTEFGKEVIKYFLDNGFSYTGLENGNKKQCYAAGYYMDMYYFRYIDHDKYEDLLRTFNVSSLRLSVNAAYNIKVEEVSEEAIPRLKKNLDILYSQRNIEERPYPDWIDKSFEIFKDRVKILSCYIEINNTKNYLENIISELQVEFDETLKQYQEKNTKKLKNKLNQINDVLVANKKRLDNINYIASKVSVDKIELYLSYFIVLNNEIIYLVATKNFDNDEYVPMKQNFLAHEYMLRYAISNNIKYYNMYGVDPNKDENGEYSGVQLFKKNFNGNIIKLIGTYQKENSFLAKYLLPYYDFIFKSK